MWPWAGYHWLGSGYDKLRLLYLGIGAVLAGQAMA